ncbi:Gfo/Idh/MocA family oxidoreductase [Deinococcus malanensis]|uniref:Gfo/Idh/MocA family oxidoreductase n=1 Tax=Deinococcus malanensis TaxID=1706855 RepID=UPI00363D3059
MEVEESLSFMLGFPGGLIANGLTSYGARTTSTLRVLGEKGSLLMDPAFPYVGVRLSLTDEQGELTPSFPSSDQFSQEFDHFAQCIREGRRPWTPGEEGVQDHVVMDAIYESARTGQVVRLKTGQGKDAFRGTLRKCPAETDGDRPVRSAGLLRSAGQTDAALNNGPRHGAGKVNVRGGGSGSANTSASLCWAYRSVPLRPDTGAEHVLLP